MKCFLHFKQVTYKSYLDSTFSYRCNPASSEGSTMESYLEQETHMGCTRCLKSLWGCHLQREPERAFAVFLPQWLLGPSVVMTCQCWALWSIVQCIEIKAEVNVAKKGDDGKSGKSGSSERISPPTLTTLAAPEWASLNSTCTFCPSQGCTNIRGVSD